MSPPKHTHHTLGNVTLKVMPTLAFEHPRSHDRSHYPVTHFRIVRTLLPSVLDQAHSALGIHITSVCTLYSALSTTPLGHSALVPLTRIHYTPHAHQIRCVRMLPDSHIEDHSITGARRDAVAKSEPHATSRFHMISTRNSITIDMSFAPCMFQSS